MVRSQWLAGAILLISSAAFAQSNPAATPPAQMDTVPEKVAPGAKPSEPSQNLSEKLNQSNGVIQPKEVDPGIEKPAPAAHDPNVIPPSAAPTNTPGAGATPQPK